MIHKLDRFDRDHKIIDPSKLKSALIDTDFNEKEHKIPFDRLVSKSLHLPPVDISCDFDEIIDLAKASFTEDVFPYVLKSFSDYKDLDKNSGLDGRSYLKFIHNGQIAGICGLHHLSWHQNDTYTAGWFFARQKDTHAVTPRHLARGMLTLARSLGCRRLIFDTISTPEDSTLSNFLKKQGLRVVGVMPSFYGERTDQTIFEYMIPKI